MPIWHVVCITMVGGVKGLAGPGPTQKIFSQDSCYNFVKCTLKKMHILSLNTLYLIQSQLLTLNLLYLNLSHGQTFQMLKVKFQNLRRKLLQLNMIVTYLTYPSTPCFVLIYFHLLFLILVLQVSVGVKGMLGGFPLVILWGCFVQPCWFSYVGPSLFFCLLGCIALVVVRGLFVCICGLVWICTCI